MLYWLIYIPVNYGPVLLHMKSSALEKKNQQYVSYELERVQYKSHNKDQWKNKKR